MSYRDTSSARYKVAKDMYKERGEQLYGTGAYSEQPKLSRKERNALIVDRRLLESRFPRVREVEEDTYRDIPSKSQPAKRLLVEFDVNGRAGRVLYPDGSRDKYANIAFASPDGMMEVLAGLVFRGIADPERTVIMTGGSAQPLLTFVSSGR
jgi:hypothetical protein